jgi:hypothetical protein
MVAPPRRRSDGDSTDGERHRLADLIGESALCIGNTALTSGGIGQPFDCRVDEPACCRLWRGRCRWWVTAAAVVVTTAASASTTSHGRKGNKAPQEPGSVHDLARVSSYYPGAHHANATRRWDTPKWVNLCSSGGSELRQTVK